MIASKTSNTVVLVLELNLSQKTVQEAIYSKKKSLLLPERHVTDHTGISMSGLLC